GIAAFAISVYWSFTKTVSEGGEIQKPTLKVIWERFPKFVLGFIFASLLFSFVIPAEVTSNVKESIKSLQGLWFALAFTSIGLETNFKELFGENSKKPFYAFVIAQGFNIVITLIIALIL